MEQQTTLTVKTFAKQKKNMSQALHLKYFYSKKLQKVSLKGKSTEQLEIIFVKVYL